jgi:hypothetical protein
LPAASAFPCRRCRATREAAPAPAVCFARERGHSAAPLRTVLGDDASEGPRNPEDLGSGWRRFWVSLVWGWERPAASPRVQHRSSALSCVRPSGSPGSLDCGLTVLWLPLRSLPLCYLTSARGRLGLSRRARHMRAPMASERASAGLDHMRDALIIIALAGRAYLLLEYVS